ncbi:MAG: hypothetical protein IJV67_02445 [Clostridia bacterium]|nr:hypothetical protein [Clostridia bacterium]
MKDKKLTVALRIVLYGLVDCNMKEAEIVLDEAREILKENAKIEECDVRNIYVYDKKYSIK